MPEEISFPRQYARTQRFTLGVPHNFSVAPDGSRVAFLRSRSGTDGNTCLWVRDVASGAEHVVADPGLILAGTREELPPEERARRERGQAAGRQGSSATPPTSEPRIAAFALSGRLFVADLTGGDVRELPAAGPVIDPRPDPAGAAVGYVSGGALRVIAADGSGDRALAEPERPGRDLRAGRVRRRRGDGPHPRLLVVSGRAEPARGAGGQQPGDPLVPVRPGPPGPARRPRSGTRSPAPRTPTSP